MKLNGIRKSDLARMAGVSRQAVSLWFAQESHWDRQVNVHSKHLLKIARSFGVPMETLVEPLFPESGQTGYFKKMERALLWDGAYLDLISFVVALVKGDERAIARLVQIVGLFQAARLVGDKIWDSFISYRRYMNPIRRKECEEIWDLQKNLGLI